MINYNLNNDFKSHIILTQNELITLLLLYKANFLRMKKWIQVR
jgi:hypothetical protein